MILDTDTSHTGIGAILSQMQGGAESVLAYGSRKLAKPEQSYCTARQELLAIVDFMTHSAVSTWVGLSRCVLTTAACAG